MDLLILKVTTHVVKQISICSEALTATLWTRKWPLVLMDSEMNFEVLLITKGLITAWIWTLERLCPIMDVHVSLKANFSCEDFTAAWMLTNKTLGFATSNACTSKTFIIGFLFYLLHDVHLSIGLRLLCMFGMPLIHDIIGPHHLSTLRYTI